MYNRPLSKYHDDNLLWCKKKLELFQKSRPVREEPHTPQPEYGEEEETQLARLQNKVFTVYGNLRALQEVLNVTQSSMQLYDFRGDFQANKLVVLGAENELNNVKAAMVAGVDIDPFLKTILELDGNVDVSNPMTLNAVMANTMTVKTVNGVPIEDVAPKRIEELIVSESVTFNESLTVLGKLQNFNVSNVLLNTGEQLLDNTDLLTNNVKIDDLREMSSKLFAFTSGRSKNYDLDTLRVKNLTLSGLLNKKNVANLLNFSLKTTGNQELLFESTFDHLTTTHLNVQELSNKQVPEDLVFINGEAHGQEVQHPVEFLGDVNFNELTVTKRLNNIKVRPNGQLDVLLKNSAHVQYVDGFKNFENVEFVGRTNYRGKVDEKLKKNFLPIRSFEEDLVLNGNITIDGTVTVEQGLSAKDMISTHYSVERLTLEGLKLTENIPVHLKFNQQLQVRVAIVILPVCTMCF